jgi:hypothetical protein
MSLHVVSVADPGCLSRIRLFSIPDPNFFQTGGEGKGPKSFDGEETLVLYNPFATLCFLLKISIVLLQTSHEISLLGLV